MTIGGDVLVGVGIVVLRGWLPLSGESGACPVLLAVSLSRAVRLQNPVFSLSAAGKFVRWSSACASSPRNPPRPPRPSGSAGRTGGGACPPSYPRPGASGSGTVGACRRSPVRRYRGRSLPPAPA